MPPLVPSRGHCTAGAEIRGASTEQRAAHSRKMQASPCKAWALRTMSRSKRLKAAATARTIKPQRLICHRPEVLALDSTTAFAFQNLNIV